MTMSLPCLKYVSDPAILCVMVLKLEDVIFRDLSLAFLVSSLITLLLSFYVLSKRTVSSFIML